MELQLDDVALFTRIAELGTLSAAARERNIPVSQVTRALTRLEGCCGVRLLHRSTHGLSLTDEGDTFLTHARHLLETRDVLASELGDKRSGPSGWVRLSASPAVAQAFIAPSLPKLYERYPALHIDIQADDRLIDMARDGIDIAIRTGSPNSDTLVAREIGRHRRELYAAPSYLSKHGTPDSPDDLARHRLIGNSAIPQLNHWTRTDGSVMRIQSHTRTDNSAMILTLAQQGVGIARTLELLARPLVERGELVSVLPGHFTDTEIPIYAVMLQERHRLPKIRACIDFWADWLHHDAHPGTTPRQSPP
jgi:DNA-binding transcriptional LysR family regulator